jgi:hypothetical protein
MKYLYSISIGIIVFVFSISAKDISIADLEHQAKIFKKMYKSLAFQKDFKLEWCGCVSDEKRVEFVKGLVDRLQNIKQPSEKVTVVSFAAGGLLQDALLVYALLQAGYTDIDIILIDLSMPHVYQIPKTSFRESEYKKIQDIINGFYKARNIPLKPPVDKEWEQMTADEQRLSEEYHRKVQEVLYDDPSFLKFVQKQGLVGQAFAVELLKLILATTVQEIMLHDREFWEKASINISIFPSSYEALSLFAGKKPVFNAADIITIADSAPGEDPSELEQGLAYPAEANMAIMEIFDRTVASENIIGMKKVGQIYFIFNSVTEKYAFFDTEFEQSADGDFARNKINSSGKLSKSQLTTLAEEINQHFQNKYHSKTDFCQLLWKSHTFLAFKDLVRAAASNKTIIGVLDFIDISPDAFAKDEEPLRHEADTLQMFFWSKHEALAFPWDRYINYFILKYPPVLPEYL